MKTMTATAFKAKCLAVMDEVNRTGERVVILKRGKEIAELGPVGKSSERYPPAALRGSVRMYDDLIEPPLPPEAWEAIGDPERVSNPDARRRRSGRAKKRSR